MGVVRLLFGNALGMKAGVTRFYAGRDSEGSLSLADYKKHKTGPEAEEEIEDQQKTETDG